MQRNKFPWILRRYPEAKWGFYEGLRSKWSRETREASRESGLDVYLALDELIPLLCQCFDGGDPMITCGDSRNNKSMISEDRPQTSLWMANCFICSMDKASGLLAFYSGRAQPRKCPKKSSFYPSHTCVGHGEETERSKVT